MLANSEDPDQTDRGVLVSICTVWQGLKQGTLQRYNSVHNLDILLAAYQYVLSLVLHKTFLIEVVLKNLSVAVLLYTFASNWQYQE